MKLMIALAVLLSAPADAETLVATRTIRSQAIIRAEDVMVTDDRVPGALGSVEAVLGKEARVILYAGRPIRHGDVGPPALIERNQIVTLRYVTGGLRITAEARALDRAGAGDSLRVMNLSSRSTVTGHVLPSGEVIAGPTQTN